MATESTGSKKNQKIPRVAVTKGEGGVELVTLSVPPLKAPKFLQGFIDFVRTQGVVGLAVGIVLGAAAKSLIDSLVKNIFNPVIGLIGNGGNLDTHFVCLKTVSGACKNKLGFGLFLDDLLSFIIIAAVVYFVVKGLRLDKIDKPKDK